jgi:hypothetical protein
MSIVGLTDQQAQLPIIGVLRKGERKTGKAPGKDLTYFRFTSEDADALGVFNHAYPDQDALRHINVFLPYQTTAENFDAWMEQWVAGGLVHRCDGKTVVLCRTQSGDYSTERQACPGGCKQVGRLAVLVQELGRLATVTVLTTSIHDIINLTRQLKSYEAINGDLRGIPFVLTRRPANISTPAGNGKRARREKWLLSIETQPNWTRLQLAATQRAALPEPVNVIEATGWQEAPGIVDLPPDAIDPGADEPEPPWDKVEFVNQAKANFDMTPQHIGQFLTNAGLMNGDGYNPDRIDDYWQELVNVQSFAKKVADQVPYYTSQHQIYEAMVELEMVYSKDDEAELLAKLDDHARKLAEQEEA